MTATMQITKYKGNILPADHSLDMAVGRYIDKNVLIPQKKGLQRILTKTGNLIDYVSDGLNQNGFPRISEEIHKLEKAVTLQPANKEEILERFHSDVVIYGKPNFEIKIGEPYISLKIKGVYFAKYDQSKVITPLENVFPIVDYSVKSNLKKQGENHFAAKLRENGSQNIELYANNGTNTIDIKGTWKSNGPVENITIKVPEIPNSVHEEFNNMMPAYYEIVKKGKEQGLKGTVLMPEFYIGWIPIQENFILTAVELPIIEPDPVLAFKIKDDLGNERLHPISFWNDEKNEIVPIEHILRNVPHPH